MCFTFRFEGCLRRVMTYEKGTAMHGSTIISLFLFLLFFQVPTMAGCQACCALHVVGPLNYPLRCHIPLLFLFCQISPTIDCGFSYYLTILNQLGSCHCRSTKETTSFFYKKNDTQTSN